MLTTRIRQLNKKASDLMIETTGLCIQMSTGKEMSDINWTGLIAKYADLLEQSMRYNLEFAEKIDGIDAKLDCIIDNMN